MSEDALRDAADRLYAAHPGDFVRARTALVKDARDAGDRDLAARIGALAKPAAAAALVNELVRDGQEDLGRVLELGADLREAQEHADRAALQRLTAERRTLLPEIAERAADRAALHGKRPGPAALEEFRQTLQAALASEAAGDAVRSGRLLRGLSADGLEDVDLGRAVAVPGGIAPAPERRRTPVADLDEQREAKKRERARAAAEAAGRKASELRRDAEALDGRATAAEQHAGAREADVAALREDLRRAEATAADARSAAREARRRADAASEEAARADAAAAEAEAAAG